MIEGITLNTEAIERNRPIIEERAKKLRILHDIVRDRFDGAYVTFEQHCSRFDNDTIAFFVVLHSDKSVVESARKFVEDALHRIEVPVRYERCDAFSVYLRPEPASSHEKMAMMRKLREGDVPGN